MFTLSLGTLAPKQKQHLVTVYRMQIPHGTWLQTVTTHTLVCKTQPSHLLAGTSRGHADPGQIPAVLETRSACAGPRRRDRVVVWDTLPRPWHPAGHVHLLLMQGHRARLFRRDFGFGKQNTVESKVRLAPFVCLLWKHRCVLQEAGLKGYRSLCWAHSPSGPQPDPAAWQNSPWGTATGMSYQLCVQSHGWTWFAVAVCSVARTCRGCLFTTARLPTKLVPHFPQHQTGFRGQSPQYHP